jgi:voltage-gated sodium channel
VEDTADECGDDMPPLPLLQASAQPQRLTVAARRPSLLPKVGEFPSEDASSSCRDISPERALPGQAEKSKPRRVLHMEAARRASTFQRRTSMVDKRRMSVVSTRFSSNTNNTCVSSMGMSEGWGETFPNDLRLPIMLRKSVQRRQNSTYSTSTGTTPGMTPGTTPVVPTRRLSFLGTRIGYEDILGESGKPDTFKRIVYHPYFDLTVACLILFNGVSIGIQTDVMARNVTEELPVGFRVVEVCFCAAFAGELLLRLIVERCQFFKGPDRAWNIFDLVVVALQLAEEALVLVASFAGGQSHAASRNFGFVRMLRALRLVRIIRLVRILRVIAELRTIVMSIVSSLKHLFWTLVLLLLMIYIFAVPLTQIVLDHRLSNRDEELNDLLLCWASIGRSSLTLFEAIFGGIDWDVAVVPLVKHVHLLLAPLFCLYIAFALLALMNVVTGVFVESAIDSANRDKEKYLVQIARDLFEKADPHQTGVITWSEFERQLEKPELQQYFKGLGVDAVSARSLFRILDLDNSGAIDADELLTGTLRLRGDARAIDLAALIYESRCMSRRFQMHASSMDEALSRIGLLLNKVAAESAGGQALESLTESESVHFESHRSSRIERP